MHPRFLRIFSSAVLVAVLAPHALAQTAPAQPAAPAQDAPARPAAEKPGEVVVTGARSEVIATADRLSFDVTKDLQVQNGTMADALRAVPGVEVDLEGNVSLRGDSGVTILIDGRPSAMMRGESRGNVLLTMPAGQIERVEVITNPSAAFSPEGAAGVLNLVTKKVRRDTRSATIRATGGTGERVGLGLSGAYSSAPWTLTGDVGFRHMRNEAEITQERSRYDAGTGGFIASRQDSAIDNTANAYNARIAADYDVGKNNRLSTEFSYREVEVEGERTDAFASPVAGASYSRDSDVGMSQRGLSGRLSWRRTLPGKGHELTADLEIESGRMRRAIDGVTDFAAGPSLYEQIRNAADRTDYTLKLDYKRQVGEGALNLGYEGNRVSTDFDFYGAQGPGWGTLVPVAALTNEFDYEQTVHAWFGTYQFELGKLEAQPGVRLEQVDLDLNQVTDGIRVRNDYFRVYPTLHLGYDLDGGQRLRASYSRRIQRPSSQDLNPYTLYADPLNLRRGNPYLRPEVTDSFELGWNKRKGPTFYSLTAFYRQSRGGVTDLVSDLGGVFLTTRVNLATAERAGAELIANGRLGKTLTYSASGTLVHTEIDPRTSPRRSGTSGNARVNLNWQPNAKDYFQLNAVYAGEQLIAQGYRRSSGILNLGYRRKLNEKFSLVLTGQNVLDSARQVVFIETPTIRDRLEQRGMGRVLMLGLTVNLGGQGPRRRPEPAFDFDPGAGAGVQ